MSYEKLNSERVNYLVWRYLQEAGFGQSAARLQRDWGITDPENLPFAPHIGPHGLIRLLQNGLRHLAVKASLNANSKDPTPFFGPDIPAAEQKPEELLHAQKPVIPLPKREAEGLTNGATNIDGALQAPAPAPAPKRSRRSNGAVNGSKSKSGESMDVDDHAIASKNENEMEIDGVHENGKVRSIGEGRANAGGEADYGDTNGVGSGASHLQGQEQHLIPTLTNGVSVGVQSDKVTDLGPETAVLNLAGSSLTQAAWNPKHPTLLAAGGRALCHIWSLASASATTPLSSPATAPQNSHTSSDLSPTNTRELEVDHDASVTALAWSPSGEEIAYSTFPDEITSLKRSTTAIWNKDGIMEDQLPGGTEPVVSLAWSPNARYLAAISGNTLLVFDKKLGTLLPPCETKHSLLDIAWLDSGQLAVCGNSIVATAGILDNKVTDFIEHHKSELAHDWSQMRYDSHTSTIAVASEDSGYLALLEASGQLHKEKAHDSTLTGLTYRPMVNSDAISSMARRLLATSSIDGTVKLWNGRAGLQHIHTFSLGAAALSLCFTPDGRHVAAASCCKMLFWSAQEGGLPKAMWDISHVDWHTKTSSDGPHHTNGYNGRVDANGDGNMDEEGDSAPSLTWDSNGHKLALACKDKVTIINYYQ